MSNNRPFDHWKIIDIAVVFCILTLVMAYAFGVKINSDVWAFLLPGAFIYIVIRYV